MSRMLLSGILQFRLNGMCSEVCYANWIRIWRNATQQDKVGGAANASNLS